MCSELDPWTNGSQLSQLDLKSTRAFQPYACLKLSVSCECVVFPQTSCFSPWFTEGAHSSTIRPKKERNSSQVSFWGCLTMAVGMKRGQDYTSQHLSLSEALGQRRIYPFGIQNCSFLWQPGIIWLPLLIHYTLLLCTHHKPFVSFYRHMWNKFVLQTHQSLWRHATNQLEVLDSVPLPLFRSLLKLTKFGRKRTSKEFFASFKKSENV